MNDFTKEELEAMHEALHHYCGPWYGELRLKVQSMIFNYCEHNWYKKHPNKIDYVICTHCGVTFQ